MYATIFLTSRLAASTSRGISRIPSQAQTRKVSRPRTWTHGETTPPGISTCCAFQHKKLARMARWKLGSAIQRVYLGIGRAQGCKIRAQNSAAPEARSPKGRFENAKARALHRFGFAFSIASPPQMCIPKSSSMLQPRDLGS